MTPEQQRIVALERTVAKMQKAIDSLEKEQKKQATSIDRLAQGAVRLERALKGVETIARRGVANATSNSNLITSIQRRFKT